MLSEPGDGESPAKETAGPPPSAGRNESKLCRFFPVTEVQVGCQHLSRQPIRVVPRILKLRPFTGTGFFVFRAILWGPAISLMGIP